MPRDPLLVVLVLLAGSPVIAGERAAPARLCPEDAPEGVRLPPRLGCGSSPEQGRRGEDRLSEDRLREPGGVDLRVGGRVGVSYGVRR